jgi:tetratricopeptide (TPR) repeat protein
MPIFYKMVNAVRPRANGSQSFIWYNTAGQHGAGMTLWRTISQVLFVGALLILLPNLAVADAQTEKLADDLFRQSRVATAKKQPDLAIQLLKRVILLSPGSKGAYQNLANVYLFDKNDAKRAEQYAKRAMALDPDKFEYRWTYGLSLMQLKKYVQARQVFLEAARLKKTPIEQTRFDVRMAELNTLIGHKP